MSDLRVEHDAPHDRYVALIGDRLIGECVYRDADEGRIFTHTGIDPALEHHGYGTRLIRGALDDTRAAGIRPIGQCPMVRNFLAEHPDYGRPAKSA